MSSDDNLSQAYEQILSSLQDDNLVSEVRAIREKRDSISLPEALTGADGGEETENLLFLIDKMTIPQKVKLALYGNKVARSLPLRDTNVQIALMVLENPRLTEGEVVDLSKNSNIDEKLFRVVSKNSTWMKNYQVKYNLVTNPKVSVDVSLKWIKHLKDKDLRLVARSKNVPGIVSTQCRKLLETRKKS